MTHTTIMLAMDELDAAHEAARAICAVRDMLLKNREARFIHILPSCMTLRHRPDSRYLQPLAEGRFLEIAQGNDETEFGRGACLALNEEIRAMALAGEGGALYWKQEGPEYTRGGA